jgi:outer membrane receptor protein involved in Fe transport
MRNIATIAVRYILPVLLQVWFANAGFAQIKGKVTDEKGNPIPFSNVLLLNPSDSSLVKGAVADDTGSYQIEDINPGTYSIAVSFVGYQTFATELIMIEKDVPVIHQKNIALLESVQVLDGLIVTEQKPLYEMQIDRIVVNVQNSITSAGSTALEVLQKSPGVLLNPQNNTLSMNGQSGVVIMINNKISRLPTDAVVQMLDGMSAANVEKIELITTPPAKFDAEGTAGIIHIVLKKNEDFGTNGSFGLKVGMQGSETLGGNANLFHRSRRIGFLVDYSINYVNTEQKFIGYRSVDHDGMMWSIDTKSIRDAKTTVQNFQTGLEYYLSDHSSVDFLITGYRRHWGLDAFTESTEMRGTNTSLTEMDIRETNIWQGATINVGWDYRFSKNQFLTFDFDYIYYQNDNPSDYRNVTFHTPGDYGEHNQIDVGKDTPVSIKVAKADYTNNFSDRFRVEAGLKGSSLNFKNDVYVANYIQNRWEEVDSLTNKAYLDEEIFAAYVSSSLKITDDMTINTGLRYEFTNTGLDTKNEKTTIDRRFNHLFPTIYFQKKLNKYSNIQLSYGRRITRPTFQDMAPFVYLLDPNTFSSGNPALRPALTDAYKAGLNWKSRLISLQYSDTKHEIAKFQPEFNLAANQMILYSRNMDRLRTWNLTSGIPFNLSEWWDVQTNITGTYQRWKPDPDSKVYGISSFSVNLTNTISLPKDYTMEFSGYYQSKSIFGLWEIKPLGTVNLGLQKKLKDEKGVLRLAANDIFNTNIWRLSAINFEGASRLNFHNQSINLTYTRRFGYNKLRKIEIRSGGEAEKGRIQ